MVAQREAAEVDNPAFVPDRPESDSNPRRISVIVNLRESSVVTLAAYGTLDADQIAAAFRFRNEWEALVNLRRPSALFERVDGMGSGLAGVERGNAAHQQLKRARVLLGEHGFALLTKVCGEGYHVRDLYQTRRERDTATDILRIHLDALATMWRLK